MSRRKHNVLPFDFADVERIVEEEIGVGISKASASFDAEPLAPAPLPQLHAPERRDRRRWCDVQRPHKARIGNGHRGGCGLPARTVG